MIHGPTNLAGQQREPHLRGTMSSTSTPRHKLVLEGGRPAAAARAGMPFCDPRSTPERSASRHGSRPERGRRRTRHRTVGGLTTGCDAPRSRSPRTTTSPQERRSRNGRLRRPCGGRRRPGRSRASRGSRPRRSAQGGPASPASTAGRAQRLTEIRTRGDEEPRQCHSCSIRRRMISPSPRSSWPLEAASPWLSVFSHVQNGSGTSFWRRALCGSRRDGGAPAAQPNTRGQHDEQGRGCDHQLTESPWCNGCGAC